MKGVPEINKTYNCFDDGKISISRLYTVDVTEVVAFDGADAGTISEWRLAVEEYSWLFAKTTDFFVFTENGENEDDAIFVRTLDGGWFSIGDFMNSGRLDVDKTLIKNLKY